MPSFHLTRDQRHLVWDNTLDPVAVVGSGDEVTLDLADASGGQIHRTADASSIARLDITTVNPCTGPVFVEGVRPGDDLVVTILELAVGEWAWTANIPGFGLLSDDFPEPHLWISSVKGGVIATPVGIDLPARPMVGTIGVAPAAPGPAPLLVPTRAGGNMDIAQLTAGSVLHLPTQVGGGLLSAGDAHAVQGDGEVCGTGAEISATAVLRVESGPGASTGSPWYEHSVHRDVTGWVCTTGIGPDLFDAAREATRRAVELLADRSGLDPIDAYLLASLTGELRISEIVDAPNWVVSMQFPATY